MAIIPVSLSEFGNKRFKRYTSYSFAAQDAIVPLVVREMPKAMMVMPLAFAKTGDSFVPVAIQGLEMGKNLFVAPDGRWVGRYVPSAYRGYPFLLAQAPEGKQVLCVDESSGLLSDSEGEPFFDGDKPSQAVNEVLNFLTQVAANRQATHRICEALQQFNLIQPWSIELHQESQAKESDPAAGENRTRHLEGLFRIDEVALNNLDVSALQTVQRAGGLPVIYCQLLSMQHLPSIGALSKLYHEAEQQASLPKNDAGELDLTFLADATTISFENL